MNEPVLTIAPAGADLVEAMAAIEALVFDTPWHAAALRSLLDGGLTRGYVARQSSDVVGTALLRVVAGEGELLRIAVAPAVRRHGIATRLLTAIQAAALDACPLGVHLEVRASNEAARRLYARAGFVETGRRRHYYEAPREDAVLMHWHPAGAAVTGSAQG